MNPHLKTFLLTFVWCIGVSVLYCILMKYTPLLIQLALASNPILLGGICIVLLSLFIATLVTLGTYDLDRKRKK